MQTLLEKCREILKASETTRKVRVIHRDGEDKIVGLSNLSIVNNDFEFHAVETTYRYFQTMEEIKQAVDEHGRDFITPSGKHCSIIGYGYTLLGELCIFTDLGLYWEVNRLNERFIFGDHHPLGVVE